MKHLTTLLILLITTIVKLHGQVIYDYAGDLNGLPVYVDANASGTTLYTAGNLGYRCDTGYTVRTNGIDPYLDPIKGPLDEFDYDANDRIDFTISPQPGYQLNITGMTVVAGRLNFGPTELKFGMNINGTGMIEGDLMSSLPKECEGDPNNGIPNAVPATHTWDIDDFNSLTPVTFTIGCSGGLNNVAIIYQVIIHGTVTPAQTIPVISNYSHAGGYLLCNDELVTLSVVTTGTPSPSYEWQDQNGNPVSGATLSSLTLSNPLPQHSYYRVRVYNSFGETFSPYTHIYGFVNDINAGTDQVLCTGDQATLNGQGSGYWFTSGDGSFDDPSYPNAIYYPGIGDVMAGSVQLEFGGYIYNNFNYEVCWRNDYLNLTIGTPATANAGFDQSISQPNTTLTGNNPSPGIGLWTLVSGTATFADSSLFNTSVSNLSNGANTLRWTISMGSCSNYDEMIVTVATTPVSAIISGDTTICNGGQAQLKIDFIGNGPFDFSYTDGVTVFGPFTTAANPEIIWVNPTSTTNYQLTSVSSGGTSGTVSGTATIQALTAPPSANVTLPFNGMPTHICNGTTANLSIASVAGATYYIWDAPVGSYFDGNPLNTSPYTSILPTVQITFGAPSGSFYTIGVQAANPCGTTLRKIEKVRGIISTPSVINGLTIACANTNGNYSTNVVTGATSYQWLITGDATVSGNGTSVSVSFGPNWSGGTLCVAAQTSCYTTVSKCINIKNTQTTAYAPSGTFTACSNSMLTYSVPSQPGVVTYNWTLPIGVSGFSTTNSITVTFGPNFVASGNICVSSTTICGTTTPPKCKTIKSGLPEKPSSITGHTTGLCNVSQTYTCPIINGATYNWTAPSGAVITGNGSNSIIVDFGTFTSGSLCVSATNNCGTGSPRCITVKGAPSKPGAISSIPSTWCVPATGIQFNSNINNLTGNYNLKWQIAPAINAAIQGPNNTNQISANWLASGTTSVQLMAYNTCGSATTTHSFNIPACKLSASNFNEKQEDIFIYPNPANDFITIHLPEDIRSDFTIELYTSEGSLVSRRIINSSQLISLPPTAGLYFIRVISPHQSQTIKLVIE